MKTWPLTIVLLAAACSAAPPDPAAEESQTRIANATAPQRSSPREARPAGTPVAVPSDPGARYWVVSTVKLAATGHLDVVTRRVDSAGERYARREVNCRTGSARYVGEAPTLAAVRLKSGVPTEMAVPAADSVTGVLVAKACETGLADERWMPM